MKQYDYIICGLGCAGMSLVYKMLQNNSLSHQSILLIDSNAKTQNDRTWCFWEKDIGLFESLVSHSWDSLGILAEEEHYYSIAPYQYKMIEGLNFYNVVFKLVSQFPNVHFVQDEVISIISENEPIVKTSQASYAANYIFNSIVFEPQKLQTTNSLIQHFKGIEVQVDEDFFNPHQARFMDFNVTQQFGNSFMYVLPTSKKTALVEFTIFSKSILKEIEYDEVLKKYLENLLNKKSYNILHTEMGAIPMTDYIFPTNDKNIIHIGTAAGWVKASSGFAFSNIQKRTTQIVERLIRNENPVLKRNFSDRKFYFYDSVLLEVLNSKKLSAANIFSSIFKKNKPTLVLRFLNNETNLLEDLKIMISVPTHIFLPIALKKLLGTWFKKN